ncbi:MAG: hypothetical protein AAB877_02230 [Patescibacteria group bacterium]
MYWKIVVNHPDTKHSKGATTEVHVGPFKSDRQMQDFREFWEKEDILEDGEKITFTPVKHPPKYGALEPKNFKGIERWKIVE